MKIILSKTIVPSVLSQELFSANIDHTACYLSMGKYLVIDLVNNNDEQAALVVIDAHDGDAAQAAIENARIEAQNAKADIDARFLLSQLANKTPQEIYTLMQNRMDSWTSLADARADLREWLPLMAAIIAWKVQ